MIRLTIAIGLASITLSAHAAVTFDEHVKPIFREHCAACHNQDDAASDLAVDGFDALIAGGAGGEVLAAGDPDGSRLWRLITHQEEPAMPPGGDKLPEDQLAVVRAWIEGGLMKDAGSKPMASKKATIAAVDPSMLGKPQGEPAMPTGWLRQPMVTSDTVGPIDALAASPWAPVVAVPWQHQVNLYHADSHELLGVAPYLDGAPRVVRFSRDGSLLLVAGGRDAALGAASVIDVVTGARLATVGDELDAVLAADISPDNQLVAIGGPKKKVRVYRTADGTLAYTCEKHTDWVTALAFSPDGQLLATGDRSAGLRLWQAQAGHERGDLRGHNAAITALAWRPGGGLLASASEDGSVRLWGPEGNAIKSINAHGGGALSVAFASDSRLVTAGRDRRVKLWKPDGAALTDLATTDDISLAAVFTADGSHVVSSDWSGQVRVWEIESKESIAQLTPNPPTLERRVALAEQRSTELAGQRPAIEAALNQAAAELEAGKQARGEFRKRLKGAQQKLSAAQAAADEAAAAARGRVEAEKATRQALTDAKSRLDEASKQLEAARQANAQTEEGADPKPTDDLVAAVADADSAVRAAEASIGQTERLRIEAEGLAGEARGHLADAQSHVERIEGQRAGLPKIKPLEATLQQHQQALTEHEQQVAKAAEALVAAAAERDRYAAALEQFASHAQQQAAAAEALAAPTEKAAASHAEAAQAAEEAAAITAEIEERIEALKAELRANRAKRAQSNNSLTEAETRLEESQAKLSEAERKAQMAQTMLEDLRAAEAWRQERAERAAE